MREPNRFVNTGACPYVYALLATVVMIFAVLPGKRSDDCLPRYEHGWPLVYLERVISPFSHDSCWDVTARVLVWSPVRSIVDITCALGIIIACVVSCLHLQRRTCFRRISVRVAILGLAIVSIGISIAGEWARSKSDFARWAIENHHRLQVAGPTWFRETATRWGINDYSASTYLPAWLLKVDGVHELCFLTDSSDAELGTDTDLAALSRAINVAAEDITIDLLLLDADDYAAQHVRQLRRCRRLHIETTASARKQWALLFAELQELRELSIRDPIDSKPTLSTITEELLRTVQRPELLEELHIAVPALDIRDTSVFKRFSNLTCLNLECEPMSLATELRLDWVPHVPRLRVLRLVDDPLSHRKIQTYDALVFCPQLDSLTLVFCTFGEDDIESLRRIKRLRVLQIIEGRMTQSAFKRLRELPQLKYLHLDDCKIGQSQIGPQQLNELRLQLPNTWIE